MNLRGWKSQSKITSAYSPTDTPLKNKVLNAEVALTNFLVQHNLPLANADHLGPLIKFIFPNSKIAQFYGCARQKTLLLSMKLFKCTVTTVLLSFAKTIPIVLVTMDQMTRE